MQSQSQQHSASADSGQAPQAQSGQFARDSRAPFAAGYQQNGHPSQPEGYHDGSAPLQADQNFQNQHSCSKYSTIKGSMPFTMSPNFALSGANRAPYNGQFVLLPSGPMLNGIPPISSFNPTSVLGPTQLGHLPYLPAMYPSASPNFPMGPATMQGYSFPFVADNNLQNLAGQKWNGWVASENQKVTGQSTSETPGNQCEFYPGPAVSTIDGPSIPLLNYNGPPQPCLPYQVMKTPNGYMLQDLESITQQEPPIPRAVPAMWTNPSEVTLAKCLENREGITNVYIRGFLPQTTDEMLHSYADRFGKIDRCKAIVDLDTGLCKGFGFVQFYNFESCENCIRGFFYLGYQASFAQKSRNSRLKDLEDKTSTNIYCTNVPITWTEADLRHHFEPYHVVSEKISRDEKTGVSKEVGFARFDTREIAEKVLGEFHNISKNGVKLLLRFADTKAQKMLKQQSNERRAYRAGEYNYSVEVVQGSTPSPSLQRLQQTANHLSPNSQVSYPSPVGVGSTWTPATSISPSYQLMKNPASNMPFSSWSTRNSPATWETTPVYHGRLYGRHAIPNNASASSSKTVMPSTPCVKARSQGSSPQKENMDVDCLSPISPCKEALMTSPRSAL
ncbi:hypothetical protein LV164_001442 [Aspergillus fumigatus]|nr:hypothetical protein KXX42_006806 [Aspergillus fumigatus]KAH1550847.1 hypothetical protein KXX57_009167 [Aspergillus fumigatus]KAH1981826.1 hypothetical protein KXW88_005214 [Aspergillus fumigatus]KAH2310196.1 hypothetical protein KXV47_005432 [Aspergillus fumigatus]KAH2654349.1 hypothetical protein KXV32_003009 [Aspergillus fumigatus]